MGLAVCLAALAALIFLAYRGFSVILIAPLAAMGAVLLTEPSSVAPAYSGLFMDRLGSFMKLYFPVFLLGAIFGKLIEISGAAHALAARSAQLIGPRRAITAIAVVGMLLTYGGVSIFVVIFAIYPFAAEMFRQANIPKRLLPATIAFSAFTITMDAVPGTPQIQNIIPTSFFGTDMYAAALLGISTAIFTFTLCVSYLEWQRRRARSRGESYGAGHVNEPERPPDMASMPAWLALLPLIVVGISSRLFLNLINSSYADTIVANLNPTAAHSKAIVLELKANAALWAVEAALLVGIAATIILGWRKIRDRFADASKIAISGSLLAATNTASEYGFGAVIASLPGFQQVANALTAIRDPLLHPAITTNILCGLTGSASGGLSLTLGAFSDQFIAAANSANIPLEVLHRIVSLASGGMDTLPHNGAVITLLAVTGLTHRQAYKDIFAITIIKTVAVFFAIALYYSTGLT